jgi:hypothetical protein
MADNTELNAGTGGDTLGSDDIAGVKYQRVKLIKGDDGVNDGDISDANPLPISDAGGALTVDGTVSVTGVATEAKQDTLIGHVDGIEALLTTIDADTGNIATSTAAGALEAGGNLAAAAASLATLDNIVAGNEAQVDVITLPAIPAGNNNIGDVDVASIAAGDNNIGNVDVVTLPAIPAGNNNIGDVDVASIAAGDNNIGNVDVLTVPTDPFGANADAASATGSISAKLRGIATALGVTALDLGSGTGGTRTLRSFQDTAQWVGGTGTDSSAVQRVSLATNVALPAGTNNIGDMDVLSVVPGTGATNLGKAEDAGHTTGDVGVMALGVRAASPTERSAGPTDGDYEPFALNEVGAVWVSPTASANGGLTIFRSIDLDETEEEVKASAGVVHGMWVTNTATSTRFVKFYNATAANVTVGSTTPVITIGIPGNTSDDVSGVFNAGPAGIGFGTAITVAATTGVADADTGAPGANEVIVNIFYK